MQRDALLYAMGGREAKRIFRTLTFVSRCTFHDRTQNSAETVEEFVTYKLCEYTDAKELIRDRFVMGIKIRQLNRNCS